MDELDNSTPIDTDMLINLIRECPAIWNVKATVYRDARKREFHWNKISEILQHPVDTLKAKWKQLKEKYVREKKANNKASGSARINRNIWEYTDNLRFIDDVVTHRVTSSNMPSSGGNNVPAPEYPTSSSTSILDQLVDSVEVTEDLIQQASGNLSPSVPNQGQVSNQSPVLASQPSVSISSNTQSPVITPQSRNTQSSQSKRKRKEADHIGELVNIMRQNNENCSCSGNEETDSDKLFLLSLLDQFKSLSQQSKRKAKIIFINTLGDLNDDNLDMV